MGQMYHLGLLVPVYLPTGRYQGNNQTQQDTDRCNTLVTQFRPHLARIITWLSQQNFGDLTFLVVNCGKWRQVSELWIELCMPQIFRQIIIIGVKWSALLCCLQYA